MGILKAACPLSPPLPGTSFPPYFTSINSRADMLPQDPGQSQLLPRGYLFAESIYLLQDLNICNQESKNQLLSHHGICTM